MPASRQACPVGLWLATSTSICRRIATICSALCFFLAMLQPPLVPVSLTFPLVQNSPVRSIGIGQTRIRQSVAGVFGDGLIEIGDRGGKVRRSPFVPRVTPLQIQLVGFWILGALFGDLLLF